MRPALPASLLAFAAVAALGFSVSGGAEPASKQDVGELLKRLAAGGSGNEAAEAARAARRVLLSDHGPEILPQVMVALDTPDIVAANWVRTVYEEQIARALKQSEPPIPVDFCRDYVRDSRRQGRARRLVLALLDRIDPAFGPQLVPTLLDDPEFRDDAVSAVLRKGDAARDQNRKDDARQAYELAFQHARDSQQVLEAADRLAALGHPVNIARHMGFVTHWHLIGPFDAPEKTGYDLVFPPEEKVDLSARYAGQTGTEIGWKLAESTDRLGQLDLIQAIAPVKEAVGYAYAELESPAEQQVQLRCSADDNLSVWLNGKKVFGRPQWLNGTRLDRFTAPVTLRAGINRVLVKVCQGPQHSDPAVGNAWSMQLRFCTADGAGVALKPVSPAVETSEASSSGAN